LLRTDKLDLFLIL
jgi:hypothetical protein